MEVGKTLASPRIYVTGRIALENGTRLAEEHHLPGRQGRLVFAFLTLQPFFCESGRTRQRALGGGSTV